MNFTKYSERINFLEYLIRSRSTGTPAQLAHRLGISERMIYRYIGYLNEIGKGVLYDRKINSYRFLED